MSQRDIVVLRTAFLTPDLLSTCAMTVLRGSTAARWVGFHFPVMHDLVCTMLLPSGYQPKTTSPHFQRHLLIIRYIFFILTVLSLWGRFVLQVLQVFFQLACYIIFYIVYDMLTFGIFHFLNNQFRTVPNKYGVCMLFLIPAVVSEKCEDV